MGRHGEWFHIKEINICKSIILIYEGSMIRRRTDKKLTSTLVIRTFLSFELADIVLKYGCRLFFKKALKKL